MLYHLYDIYNASLTPARTAAEFTKQLWENPHFVGSHTYWGRSIAASAELF
ncbi:MAG TPA: polyhydroxyalkanoate depolymerase, partial [Rhodospirillaceae bacterium]|nr:polyhydroxyalkanoate depolymerase [Rhodospirillaceae bacterium]